MRHGVIIAFLASSSVYSELLAHAIALANAIRQLLQYGPPTGSQLGQLVCRNSVWVWRQSEFSKDQIENSALLSSGCGTDPISDQRILRWGFAVCELVYIHSNYFLPLCRLLALRRIAPERPQRPLLEESRTRRAERSDRCL